MLTPSDALIGIAVDITLAHGDLLRFGGTLAQDYREFEFEVIAPDAAQPDRINAPLVAAPIRLPIPAKVARAGAAGLELPARPASSDREARRARDHALPVPHGIAAGLPAAARDSGGTAARQGHQPADQ